MQTCLRILGCALLSWLGSTAVLLAQSAQVSGRVADASGGGVPGATVTAVNEATGLQRDSLSNAEGYYAIPSLPPGPYRLTAELSGFAQARRSGLTLVADHSARQLATDWNNFGPRVGFAYQADPRTAVRAGYGIFYVPMVTLALGSIGFNNTTPWVSSVDGLRPENLRRTCARTPRGTSISPSANTSPSPAACGSGSEPTLSTS